VFDDQGWLVGVISSGVDGGTSFVTLAMAALACPFEAGSPHPGTGVMRSLLSMSGPGGGCAVERPELLVATYPHDGKMTSYVYTTWQRR
jgi:hypothetical protein